MSELYFMMTITSREMLPKFLAAYDKNNLPIGFVSLGYGTAKDDILDMLGLVRSEKAVGDTTMELLVVVSNQGHNDLVMDAARGAGAYGGTVIHARGTGMNQAELFFGVSLASEKDLTFIVTKKSQRNAIMSAIMKDAGMETPAQSIVFSLPVTDAVGLNTGNEDTK